MLLFALRYEREGRAQTTELLRHLEARGLSHGQLGLARTLLVQAGAERRTADLFSDRTFSSRFATLAKQSLRVRGRLLCFCQGFQLALTPHRRALSC